MPRPTNAPYSISYLKPKPNKVADPAHPKRAPAWPADYIARVQRVFDNLRNPRAKAAFYALYRPIVGHHQELEGMLYNAPPHWDDATMTATEVDGAVIEKYRDPDSAGENG